MDRHSQLPLSFAPLEPDYTRAGFVLNGSTANALMIADRWAASNEPQLVICGGEGAGKTHLAKIITQDLATDIVWLDGGSVTLLDVDPVHGSVLVIDDVHNCENTDGLLAIMSASSAVGARLILVGREQPVEWADGLADLETRLEAMPRLRLEEPDEALLRAVIQKLFLDRQLRVDPSLSAYVVPRLPRTFAAAKSFVEAADALAAEKNAPITKVLAGNVINNLSEGAARS